MQAQSPRVGELVIANITKVMKFGAYCKLPEYNDLEVFLPIREVSSGWIKNIREFIHEGQKVVCEVAFFDKEKNTIDVSIKRVSPKNAKEKIRAYNLEKRLGALFAQALKEAGEQGSKAQLTELAVKEFGSYTKLVEGAKADSAQFKDSKLPKKLKSSLLSVLEANTKEKKYVVSYIATLSTYNTKSGASELRNVLSEIKGSGIGIHYISAPKYRFVSEGADYADAEKKIAQASTMIKEKLKNGMFMIEKEKLKKSKEDIMEGI